MKVVKVIGIVVALHVLVIGGIFIFEGCSRSTKAPVPDLAQGGPSDEQPANQTNSTASTTGLDQPQSLAPTTPTAVTQPAAPTPTVAAPVHAARTYVVKSGDSLWKIAKAEHVSVGDLARANNLTKSSTVKVNQKLTIPAKSDTASTQVAAATSASPATADATAPAAAGGNVYVVKSGDSLWKIARSQNISVAALKQANNLASDSLKVNQKLTIPAATAAAPAAASVSAGTQASAGTASYSEWQPGQHVENGQTFHVVDIGETPTTIARKYGVKLDDLMKSNNLGDGKRVAPGQKLVIPGATAPATTAAPTPAMAAPIVSSGN